MSNPISKTVPGRVSYEVTSGDVIGMAGEHGIYRVAILEFESMATIGANMASPQGQVAADFGNFASAAADVMMGDTKMV